MTLKQLSIWILGIVAIVAFYFVNRHGGFAGDVVYRQALKESNGNTNEAIRRLGTAYEDPQGNLIHLTLDRSIRRQGKARSLPNYQLGNSILAKVNQFETIEHLTVGHPTWIDDGGMKHIAKMPRLKTLSLKFTKLTRTGLNDLLPLTSLRVLYVDGTHLTAEDAQAFERAMPDCQVILWPTDASKVSPRRMRFQSEFIEAVRTSQLRRFEYRTEQPS